MSEKLVQYKSGLTPRQAAEGIALARSNAMRLIADAELLLEAGRQASASALAILAIEELGKVQAIKIIVLQSGEAALRKAWKDYRSHRAKNVQWILPKLAAEGARTMMQLRAAADPDSEHTAMLDSVKQLALYTDCFNDSVRWSEPTEAIDPKFAEAILSTAHLLSRDRETTERELVLWVTIVGPHYDKPTMVDALLRFQAQVHAEGLSATTPEALEAFVKGRPVEVKG